MNLFDQVLEKEKQILSELGYGLTAGTQFQDSLNPDTAYKETYYKDFSLNLYDVMNDIHKKQYGGGSGGELNTKIVESKRDPGTKYTEPAKMSSIRSSSAMTFNILGNSEISLCQSNVLGCIPGVYRISYEKKIPTITSNDRQQPANLDAYLTSEDGFEIIFCEMKMMEWFSKNYSDLKSAYTEKSNYMLDVETTDKFLKAIDLIKEEKAHHDTFAYYDVWQMLKHTIAVYNYMNTVGWNHVKQVTLLNVVFEPEESFLEVKNREKYKKQKEMEHLGFEKFQCILKQVGLLDVSLNFQVRYLSVKEFMECLVIDPEKKGYLKRYTFV